MHNLPLYTRLRSISIVLAVMLSAIHGNLLAQRPQNAYGHSSPNGYLDQVIDMYGNKYTLGQLAIDHHIRVATGGSEASLMPVSCSSGYFQIHVEPGCGFDPSYTAGAERLNVLCQVLHDLSDFIWSPLDTVTTGQKINLWVRPMSAVGGGPFLAVASSFYNLPAVSTYRGIADNTLWMTLNSGIDAYKNVAGPIVTAGGAFSSGSTFFHGMVSFDTTANWNTNLFAAPSPTQYDLYTTALHEMVHALGFMSLIKYDGTSNLGPAFKYYSRYDRYLQTATGDSLLKHSGSCADYNWTFNTSLTPLSVLSPAGLSSCPLGYQTGPYVNHTDCSTAIKYVNGTLSQEVYHPNCYERGSSLSHFEDECAPHLANDQYFVMSNAVPPGVMKRFIKPSERIVLCDLGYSVNNVFGSGHLNDTTYAGGVCNSAPQVVGICDGVATGGAYAFIASVSSPAIINGGPIGSILDNDFQANAFKCLELVIGSGALSATSGTSTTTVSFTPAVGSVGVHLLRYIPYNSVTGKEGNITYVYVFVGDASCGSVCNIVSNGGFESVTGPGCGPSIVAPGLIKCWSPLVNTPDLFGRGCAAYSSLNIPNSGFNLPTCDTHAFSSYPNDRWSGLYASHSILPTPSNSVEALQTLLSSELVYGTKYVARCWGKVSNRLGFYMPFKLQFAASSSVADIAPASGGGITGLASISSGMSVPMISLATFTIPDNNWRYLTDTFTYLGSFPGRRLAVIHATYLNTYSTFYDSYLQIDDISIVPEATTCYFTLPPSTCSGSSIIDLSSRVSRPGGTFSWYKTGPPITLTHDVLFDPSVAAVDASGLVTIAYTFTDGLGCTQTVYGQIQFVPSAIAGAASICTGAITTMSCTPTGGTWTSGSPSIATIVPTSGVLTSVSPGTTVISYIEPGGCSTSRIITVNLSPGPITGSTTVCNGSTSTLSNSVAGGIWAATSVGVVAVGSATGVVSGLSGGTATVVYTLPTSCSVSTVVTVSPDTIAGLLHLCAGDTTTLTNASPSGTWSSSSPTTATIGSFTGLVLGLAMGTSTISYTVSGCTATALLTVDASPAPIAGPGSVCVGSNMTLTNPVTGGSWTSSNLSVALIDISSGIVTGVSVGTTTITYTSTSGCFVTTIVTVSPTLATAGASFSSSGIDSSVSFVYTGTLTALDSVGWDFGDGTSDTGLLTTHTYSASGTYTVCATAYGICWSDISCDTVTVTLPIAGMSPIGVAAIKIFPNPARTTLEITGLATSSVYRLQSVTGVTLQRGALHLNKETLNIDWLVPGMYILEIEDIFGYRSVFRIIKE